MILEAISSQTQNSQLLAVRPAGIRLVSGRAAVLAMHGALVDLSARCGQTGAMDYLAYFLSVPATAEKIPHLILFTSARTPASSGVSVPALEAAVLVHEYQKLGFGLGVFVGDDMAGERSVIAPPGLRGKTIALAAQELMSKGAQMVLLSYKDRLPQRDELSLGDERKKGRWAWSRITRDMALHLPLEGTLDATLATLGKHTRRNLRTYRRRAESGLNCTFIPEAELKEVEFLAFNRACAYPAPEELALWRYNSLQNLPGRLFAGLRAGNGDWLSLVAGRTHHGSTKVDWQLNRDGFPSYSLSTVLRAYLLEYEIDRGTRELCFEGGTPHSMRHSFVPQTVSDLIVLRRGVRAFLLRRYAHSYLPETNFLAQTLSNASLRWQPW